MSIKKRIDRLESLLSYTPGKIILIEQINENTFKEYDYCFKELDKTYTEKQIREIQETNNVLFINLEDRSKSWLKKKK